MLTAMTEAPATDIFGYHFTRPALLREALTHRSAALGRARKRAGASNERLEFIGDRVLGLIIAEWLAERFPDEPEGKLGPRLASLVSRDTLAEVGEEIGLTPHLTLGASEELGGVGKLANVIADAMEAVIGAMYLDGGLTPARDFVRTRWEGHVSSQKKPPQDAKSALQSWLQGRGAPLPEYVVESTAGPSHAPIFVVCVRGAGKEGRASAASKRAAERDAAAALLAQLT